MREATLKNCGIRIAFPILITNVDYHLRSHGLLHEGHDVLGAVGGIQDQSSPTMRVI